MRSRWDFDPVFAHIARIAGSERLTALLIILAIVLAAGIAGGLD